MAGTVTPIVPAIAVCDMVAAAEVNKTPVRVAMH
jgi:hypothetical protein